LDIDFDTRIWIFELPLGNLWINLWKSGQLRRYACKVLFSGVFQDASIFQDGGWDMDETGKNG